MTMIRKHEGDNIPSDSWTLGNRLLMNMQGTEDARGFRQWEQIHRRVKKGAKAIHIFKPMMKKSPKQMTKQEKKSQKWWL